MKPPALLAAALALLLAITLVNLGGEAPSPEVAGRAGMIPGGAGGLAREACRLELRPSSIAVQPSPVRIAAVPASPIGSVRSVYVDEASRLVVVDAVEAAGESVWILLDPGRAIAGEWMIELRGSTGSCGGTIIVRANSQSNSQSNVQPNGPAIGA